mmetsp:Transcript_14286/g.16509  ORF Transcript_14286/g.16509 Transcript_14286/m.16509 type:complete len:181 (-) Transcript_14286:41-583(-)
MKSTGTTHSRSALNPQYFVGDNANSQHKCQVFWRSSEAKNSSERADFGDSQKLENVLIFNNEKIKGQLSTAKKEEKKLLKNKEFAFSTLDGSLVKSPYCTRSHKDLILLNQSGSQSTKSGYKKHVVNRKIKVREKIDRITSEFLVKGVKNFGSYPKRNEHFLSLLKPHKDNFVKSSADLE